MKLFPSLMMVKDNVSLEALHGKFVLMRLDKETMEYVCEGVAKFINLDV